MRKPKLRTLMLVLLWTPAASALIVSPIVHDPISNGIRAAEAASLLAQGLKVYEQSREFVDYRALMDGRWREAVKPLQRRAAEEALERAPLLEDLGFEAADLERLAGVRSKAGAISELSKIVRGAGDAQLSETRGAIEELWGEAPQTREGVSIEWAQREIAEALAHSGRVRRALTEKTANVRLLRGEFERGGLVPGDLERVAGRLESESIELDALRAETGEAQLRLTAATLGFTMRAAGNAERSRLRERARRLEGMGGVNFGLETAEARKGVE